jgi:hypothetical protein
MRDAYEIFVGKIIKGQGKYRIFVVDLKGIGRSSVDWIIQLVHDLGHS